jgi:hypothetical protein
VIQPAPACLSLVRLDPQQQQPISAATGGTPDQESFELLLPAENCEGEEAVAQACEAEAEENEETAVPAYDMGICCLPALPVLCALPNISPGGVSASTKHDEAGVDLEDDPEGRITARPSIEQTGAQEASRTVPGTWAAEDARSITSVEVSRRNSADVKSAASLAVPSPPEKLLAANSSGPGLDVAQAARPSADIETSDEADFSSGAHPSAAPRQDIGTPVAKAGAAMLARQHNLFNSREESPSDSSSSSHSNSLPYVASSSISSKENLPVSEQRKHPEVASPITISGFTTLTSHRVDSVQSTPSALPAAALPLLDDLGLTLEQMHRTGSDRLQINLPVADGKHVGVEVQILDGVVHAVISTDSTDLREAIESGWVRLVSKSEALGMAVANPVFKSPAGNSADLSQHHPKQQWDDSRERRDMENDGLLLARSPRGPAQIAAPRSQRSSRLGWA